MERFAFIIHPVDVRRDLARKFPAAAYAPVPVLEAAVRYIPPMVTAHIVGVKSKTGAEAEGWFIGCPLTPKQLLTLPPETVLLFTPTICAVTIGPSSSLTRYNALGNCSTTMPVTSPRPPRLLWPSESMRLPQ